MVLQKKRSKYLGTFFLVAPNAKHASNPVPTSGKLESAVKHIIDVRRGVWFVFLPSEHVYTVPMLGTGFRPHARAVVPKPVILGQLFLVVCLGT